MLDFVLFVLLVLLSGVLGAGLFFAALAFCSNSHPVPGIILVPFVVICCVFLSDC